MSMPAPCEPHVPQRPEAHGSASARDAMLIATHGQIPNATGQLASKANMDTMPAVSIAAAKKASADNKENFNFIQGISESIKQLRRRASNKCPGVSPAKLTSQSSLPGMAAAVSPIPLQKRQLPNGAVVPPSRKRPRCESEADELNTVKDPQRLVGNIAELLLSETNEMTFPSSSRSPPDVLLGASQHHMLSNPQPAQPWNVLSSLSSTLNTSAGIQLDGTTDRVMRKVPNQLSPQHEEFLAIVNRDQYGVQANPLKPRSLESDPDSSKDILYRPTLYPDPVLQPRIYPELQSQEAMKRSHVDSEQWYEMPSTYPQPHIQPTTVSIRHRLEQPPTQQGAGSQDENAQAPSTYPQPAAQPSPALMGTGLVQQHAEPLCEGDVLPSLNSAQQHSFGQVLGQAREHLKSPAQPFKSQQQATLPETVSSSGTLTTETVLKATKQVSNAVSAANMHPNINENGFTARAEHEQNTMGSAPSSEQDQNDMPSRHQPSQHQPRRSSPDDGRFITQVIDVLNRQRQWKRQTFGKRQAARIHQVLSIAKNPDASEALFLSGDEAAQYFQPNASFPGIIVTMDEQPRPLQSTTEFLAEFYDDSATVFIQDPAVDDTVKKPAGPRNVTIRQVKEKFLKDAKSKKKNPPWNCLELATHVEDGLRPAFLSGEDCRLLTKLKHPSKENEKDKAGRRGYLEGWKEVEKWALLAQAGALTEPHQDSHGYNTYITVNQGVIGFGWLANPTAEERAEWRKSPHAFVGGKWRYVVLRPGHTVYFPSGTVHFVFRLAALGDTLAFGGHVLRCSQIVRWIKTILEEQADPAVTNEDLTESAPAYLDRVEKFVKQALQNGRVDIWGGKENIEEFLALKAEFEIRQANR